MGGSIAALTIVQTLRLGGFQGSIALISNEDIPPYTRVPLSKGVLADRESLTDIALAEPAAEAELLLGVAATGLDLASQRVLTTAGPMRYDQLAIATGGRARSIGQPDQHEFVLRSYGDVERLKGELSRARSVVIVGSSVLGMEIASTCCDLGKQVTVIDMIPPLRRLLGDVVGDVVATVATARGVTVLTSAGGVQLLGSPRVTGVRTSDGDCIEADVVVSAVGDVPNVEWLAESGLATHAGVIVDQHCRAAAGVVAAGDVAVVTGQLRSPTWTNAVEQGRAAALTLLHGDAAAPFAPSHYMWTEQFGLNIKVVGEPGPLGQPEVVAGDLAEQSAVLAWPDAQSPRTVISFNHSTPVIKLKRWVTRSAQVAPAGRTPT